MGDVIVWGVECKQTDDGDCAQDATPIKGVEKFCQGLEGRHDLISPGINGIEHVPLYDPNDASSGFVATYIPRSEGEPQQAMAKDTRTYYVRIGPRTLPMEPFMVADRYRVRPQPILEVFYKYLDFDNGALSFRIGIRNVGRGIAKELAIAVDRHENCTFHATGPFVNAPAGVFRSTVSTKPL